MLFLLFLADYKKARTDVKKAAADTLRLKKKCKKGDNTLACMPSSQPMINALFLASYEINSYGGYHHKDTPILSPSSLTMNQREL